MVCIFLVCVYLIFFFFFTKKCCFGRCCCTVLWYYLCVFLLCGTCSLDWLMQWKTNCNGKETQLFIFSLALSLAVYAFIFCILTIFARYWRIKKKQHYITRRDTHFVSSYNFMNHRYDPMKRELKPNENGNVENA